jgi:endonuclease YncB( thermonuclease family)
MALLYRKHAHERFPEDQGSYQFAEPEARDKMDGFWRDANPKQPGEYGRRNQ